MFLIPHTKNRLNPLLPILYCILYCTVLCSVTAASRVIGYSGRSLFSAHYHSSAESIMFLSDVPARESSRLQCKSSVNDQTSLKFTSTKS